MVCFCFHVADQPSQTRPGHEMIPFCLLLQVIHHHKLGQSKEEFLHLNGPQMATAAYILVLMTDSAIASPFVFQEILFADWLGKKLVTAMFRNTWERLRPALKAVLGKYKELFVSFDFMLILYHFFSQVNS